ncbi:MAG: ribosomal RNA small subunit methyltransferase A [Chloroflexi bacterium]|nr:ribosomal RNA small subunit methyltransferase A [Chloroflexota bacterium]
MPAPAPSSAATRRQLRSLGLRPRKALGQHFLVDPLALEAILAAAELGPADTVIEVGPGLGALTAALAQVAGRVIAVELDPALAQALERRFPAQRRVTVVQGDILRLPPAALLAQAQVPPPYKVVSNLPYAIATATIRHFLEASPPPSLMVVTVQREVARAMVAAPGAQSLLSVAVQLYGEPALVRELPPQSFHPAPKVASGIVRIRVRGQPAVAPEAPTAFLALVQAGFAARRKQLRNSLAQGLGIAPAAAGRWLERCGIGPTRRAETLTLPEWEQLYRTRGT